MSLETVFPIFLPIGSIIESRGVKVVTPVTDYVRENARTFRHNRRTRSNPIMCNGDGVTAKTAITLTTDHDCNVKISTKRQHQEITTSTGQDKEALLVQGNGHKGGDIAHVQPLDVVLPAAALNPTSTRQFNDLMKTSTIPTTASMKRNDDNDSGTTDTALCKIMEEKQLDCFKE
jgi:hypothetical protein